MNTTGKVISGIVIVVVVVGGAFFLYQQMQPMTAIAPGPVNTTASNSVQQPVTPAPTAEQTAASVNPLPSGTDTSDAGLTKDAASIDTQMSGLSSDNTSVTQSVTDQAGAQ